MEYNACMSSIGKQNIATLVYDWFMRKKLSCKENLQSLLLRTSEIAGNRIAKKLFVSIFFLTGFWDYLNASVFANIVNSYLIQSHSAHNQLSLAIWRLQHSDIAGFFVLRTDEVACKNKMLTCICINTPWIIIQMQAFSLLWTSHFHSIARFGDLTREEKNFLARKYKKIYITTTRK